MREKEEIIDFFQNFKIRVAMKKERSPIPKEKLKSALPAEDSGGLRRERRMRKLRNRVQKI